MSKKDNHVVVKQQAIIPLGGSRVISLPRDWIKFIERQEKRRFSNIYTLMDEILIVSPEGYVKEYTNFLNMWSRLTPGQKRLLIKLGRQYREVTRRKLTQREIEGLLKVNPEIREFVMNEVKNKQEEEIVQEVQSIA